MNIRRFLFNAGSYLTPGRKPIPKKIDARACNRENTVYALQRSAFVIVKSLEYVKYRAPF